MQLIEKLNAGCDVTLDVRPRIVILILKQDVETTQVQAKNRGFAQPVVHDILCKGNYINAIAMINFRKGVSKGTFINDVTLRGGEGVSNFVTECDRRGGGGKCQCDVTLRYTYIDRVPHFHL